MKFKILLFSIVLFISAVFYNCSKSGNPTFAEKYPNQDSELALLMREMDADATKIKTAIQKNKSFADYRIKFAQILSAKHTDSSTNNEAFIALSKSFLANLDKIYKSDKPLDNYNLMIRDCLNCHSLACPGPTGRIKKLLIE